MTHLCRLLLKDYKNMVETDKLADCIHPYFFMCFFFLYVITDEQNVDESVILKPLADYSFRLPGRKNCRC